MIAKVDATKEPELAKRFDVTGYPTMKIFKKGRYFDYEGERNSEYGKYMYMYFVVVSFSRTFTHKIIDRDWMRTSKLSLLFVNFSSKYNQEKMLLYYDISLA